MTPWTPTAFSGRHQETVLLCRACDRSRVASRALPASPQPLCVVSGERHRVSPSCQPSWSTAQTSTRPPCSSVQPVRLGVQLRQPVPQARHSRSVPGNLARSRRATRAHSWGVHCSRSRCFISKQERKSYPFFIQIFSFRYVGL